MAKKAVLIFDMPETCMACPLLSEEVDDYCTFNGESIQDVYIQDKRPDWCPLIETTKADITRARMFLNRIENERENRL